jgi:hypothetical protein
MAEDVKRAKQQKKDAGLKRIAEIEEGIETADAHDATPRPNFRGTRAAARRASKNTTRLLHAVGDNDTDAVVDVSSGHGSSDEFNPPSMPLTEPTDVEEPQPPRKKTKASKPSVRELISANKHSIAREPSVADTDEESVGGRWKLISHGKQI